MKSEPNRAQQLECLLRERIVVLDGAMGTMVQQHKLDEAAYRGERFNHWHKDLKGLHDLLCLTQDIGQARGEEETSHGQGPAKIEQRSAQTEEGEGQDQCLAALAEGRRARAGESEEQLAGPARPDPVT